MGSSETARTDSFGDPIEHAFLWTAGKIVDLGVPVGGLATQAWGINEDREVILTAHVRCPNGSDDFWWSRAFVWQGGRMIDLGAVRSVITGWGLRNASSYVVAISDHGAVPGGSYAQGCPFP